MTATKRAIELQPGERFGCLTVIERAPSVRGGRRWKAACDCGREVIALGSAMRRGVVISCGHVRLERARVATTKHGYTPHDRSLQHPLYRIWLGMKNRCNNPRTHAYVNYGARGIQVCQRWLHDFAAFLADVGERPSPQHSLERKNNAGDYEPENVVWATLHEQSRNKRTNVILTHEGRTMCLSDWSSATGIKLVTLSYRARRGWPVEQILGRVPKYERHM